LQKERDFNLYGLYEELYAKVLIEGPIDKAKFPLLFTTVIDLIFYSARTFNIQQTMKLLRHMSEFGLDMKFIDYNNLLSIAIHQRSLELITYLGDKLLVDCPLAEFKVRFSSARELIYIGYDMKNHDCCLLGLQVCLIYYYF
jgi:hypothetical protein